MASINFLVLISIALVPFAMARQNPSDKEASQIDLAQKDGLYEPLGIISKSPLPSLLPTVPILPSVPVLPTLPPIKPPFCSSKPFTAQNTDLYETSGAKVLICPPPPAPTPAPTPGPGPTPTPTPTPSPSPTPPPAPAPTPTPTPAPAPAPV